MNEPLLQILHPEQVEVEVCRSEERKRNKKVASTSRLRVLTGALLDMALVARFAHQSHLLEEGENMGECTRTTHCTNAHARPCHRVPRLALPAPRDGHV